MILKYFCIIALYGVLFDVSKNEIISKCYGSNKNNDIHEKIISDAFGCNICTCTMNESYLCNMNFIVLKLIVFME